MARTKPTTDLPHLPSRCPRCEQPISISVLLTEDNLGGWACDCGACSPRFDQIRLRPPQNEAERRLEQNECMPPLNFKDMLDPVRSLERQTFVLDTQSLLKRRIAAFVKKWFDPGNPDYKRAIEIDWRPEWSLLTSDAPQDNPSSKQKPKQKRSKPSKRLSERVQKMREDPENHPFMTVREASCALLDTPTSTIYRWATEKKLERAKRGMFVTKSVLEYRTVLLREQGERDAARNSH